MENGWDDISDDCPSCEKNKLICSANLTTGKLTVSFECLSCGWYGDYIKSLNDMIKRSYGGPVDDESGEDDD